MMNRYLLLVGELEQSLEFGAWNDTATQDQAKAASDEAEALVVEQAFHIMDTRPGSKFRQHVGMNRRRSAMVLAAFRLEGTKLCPHHETLQPFLAILPCRVVVCRACAAFSFAKVIDPQDCDFCGQPVPDNEFGPVILNLNHLTAFGDACAECYEAITEEWV